MRKKLLSFALALALCLGLTVPAFAAETITYPIDDNITVTANPDGTLSFTGTGEFWMDYMYMGLEILFEATDGLDGVNAVSMSIGSGITSAETGITLMEMAQQASMDIGLLGEIPLYVNGALVQAVQQPTKPDPKPEPAPAPEKEAITEDFGDGIQITADPNGTLSYTGAGDLTPDHVAVGMEMLYYVTDGLEGVNGISVSIAPGITHTALMDEAIAYGFSVSTVEELFKVIMEEMGLDMPGEIYVNKSPAQQPAAGAGKVSVNPNSSTVLVNGQNVSFDAYTIEGSNYFKLRDLAYVLNGTEKQFEVGWDNASKTITLTSGQGYTAVGGEMAAKGSSAQSAAVSASKLLIDGKEVSLTAYTINGNNYFKLRDIGQAYDFGIGWDNATKTITIDTSTGYTA